MLLWLLAGIILFWVALGAFGYWSTRGATTLRPDSPALSTAVLPKVSIIVAARNEEEVLSDALASLVQLDYPDYEIILVDDDSRDRTGEIADEWARNTEAAGRLRVIHNRELPPGWSGKVHALHLAAAAARGEWLLATDADVIFHPAALRRAVECAFARDAQLLSTGPEFEFRSSAEKIVLPAFSMLLGALFPLRWVNSLKSRRAIAAGAFILMRRDHYEALGGYAQLRGVVVEDLRIAELFKRNGRRTFVAFSRGLFRTRMYSGWRELWEGLERSAFEGAGFSILMVLAGVAAGMLTAVLPPTAVLVRLIHDASLATSPLRDPVLLGAAAACAASWLVYLPVVLYFRVSPLYVLTLPLAALFYSLVALDSMLVSLAGRGVPWKGRRYRPQG